MNGPQHDSREIRVGRDYIEITGDRNVVHSNSAASPARIDPATLSQLVQAIAILRPSLTPADQVEIQQAVQTIHMENGGDGSKVKTAAQKIAAIAALVGEVGAPVISSVRLVLQAAGIA